MNIPKIPLWIDANASLFSGIFSVPEGYAALLTATGYEGNKVRADASEVVVPKSVCVRKILSDFTRPDTSNLRCDCVFDMTEANAVVVVDQIVRTCGAPWQLTGCRNIGIIGLPGYYRLEMNDSTIIGTAQVYLELIPVRCIPHHIKHLFF